MDKLIIIGGPTASSKSDVAIECAKAVNGEIINADSMQIYKNMDIGTAKVTLEERNAIVHHLIDIVEYNQPFTACQYAQLAKAVISDIIGRGKTPILCGGTGLYIDSVIYPFDFGSNNDVNDEIRKKLYDRLNKDGAQTLHAELMSVDPEDAIKIHPNNTKRLIRALEIYYSTGKTKSQLSDKQLQYDITFLALNRDREELYKRINQRVDMMFEKGLEQEVRSLVKDESSFEYQSMQAIGYKEFRQYLYGDATIGKVKDDIKLNSRHYAKRQITWLKKYEFCKFVSPDNAAEHILNEFC